MLSKYRFLYCHSQVLRCRRWKSLYSDKKVKNKNSSAEKALEHFDDFYKPLFDKNWPSIRLGLLTEQKYVAVLNNYSDVETIQSSLENLGAISIRRLFEVESTKYKRKKKKNKGKTASHLETKLAEISERKAEEEHKDLYPMESKESQAAVEELCDRYIDPSVSVSQLHEYIPATVLKGSEDWLPESEHFSYYSPTSDFSVRILKDDILQIPENLHLYTFEPGNIMSFPHPRRGSTGVSDYFLLDGGSILPVLALDIQPEDVVLDMCAAPGGKSFLALQTLCPRSVVCNDVSESRVNRIKKLMKEFYYNIDEKMDKGEIRITRNDARLIHAPGYYNKILVDVPCTNDRLSANEDDNNIFKPMRLKERIKLPEIQSEILISALKQVAVGGTVVYSTCSLSPIQNDGVVHMALQKITEEADSEIAVVDMTDALEPSKVIFKYGNIGLRYGHLVVPYILSNFGPTYFCKLIKVREGERRFLWGSRGAGRGRRSSAPIGSLRHMWRSSAAIGSLRCLAQWAPARRKLPSLHYYLTYD